MILFSLEALLTGVSWDHSSVVPSLSPALGSYILAIMENKTSFKFFSLSRKKYCFVRMSSPTFSCNDFLCNNFGSRLGCLSYIYIYHGKFGSAHFLIEYCTLTDTSKEHHKGLIRKGKQSSLCKVAN
jgi:hypothetical protein